MSARYLLLRPVFATRVAGIRGFSSSAAAYNEVKDFGKTFDKILIANRGEIACRVIRSCKKMGIKTVAIHSEADSSALHVRLADEAVCVGPAPSSQSYLNIPIIMDAIRKTGAQAVHPGYGFLSENSHFSGELQRAGVTFIGPSEYSIAEMGDKIESKRIARAAGVHCIPGHDGVVKDVDECIQVANKIGYPVMIKASAGGGGKGMRIAWNDQEAREGFRLSSQEAKASFADDRLLVEKYIDNPRHIEIQIIGDKHGKVLYLPERECSIQRRNQKVIEEAPSFHLDDATRRAMGEQAVQLAQRVKYYSAGTVEFLVDSQRNFYFLEMNTRLQVEHPITEYITGLDLVELMIRVAAGQPLPHEQKDIKINGWAFESRVYAEDSEKFLPSIGRLNTYVEPKGHGNVRVDSGIVEGSEINMFYDPLIAKLVTYGHNREEARVEMTNALDRYIIKGVKHNVALLREVINHPRFKAGRLSTKFLPEEFPGGFKGTKVEPGSAAYNQLAVISAFIHAKRQDRNRTWTDSHQGQAAAISKPQTFWFGVDKNEADVVIQPFHKDLIAENIAKEFFEPSLSEPAYLITINGQHFVLQGDWRVDSTIVEVLVNKEKIIAQFHSALPVGYQLQFKGTKFDVTVKSPLQSKLAAFMKEKVKADTESFILSPMPGNVISVNVKVGDVIAEGQEVAIVEAMKMQNVLRAGRSGKVKSVRVTPGTAVAADDVIVEFESEPKKAAAAKA